MRSGLVVAAMLAAAVSPGESQGLEVTPNLTGVWTADAGVVHFHTMHRFEVTPPPINKVVNTPTMLLGAGLGRDAMVAARYATSSRLVRNEANEWEVYGRWSPVKEERLFVDGAVRAGWNGTAESVDGELALARSLGPIRLHLSGRAFSAWRGGASAMAAGGGVVWRAHRWVALAADAVQLLDDDVLNPADPAADQEVVNAELAWSGGVQLAIPYTPHTLSLHVTNVNATTLQSSSVGIPEQRLYGFEFTVPLTLSRYFGGRSGSPGSGGASGSGGAPTGAASPSQRGPAVVAAAADTAVVTMDNRLRFLPDTIRVRAGQAVRWENPSALVHTVTADPSLVRDPAHVSLPAGAETFDSGDIVPGETYTRVFTVPGTYLYTCLPHEPVMSGVVIVEGGPAGGSSP